uniref:UFSP1/2/DUB catalytic domain-containing protein n=1 Tax=Amphora coffeiformis TaxID=265554 RepID=A0A7S3L3G7_9STRA
MSTEANAVIDLCLDSSSDDDDESIEVIVMPPQQNVAGFQPRRENTSKKRERPPPDFSLYLSKCSDCNNSNNTSSDHLNCSKKNKNETSFSDEQPAAAASSALVFLRTNGGDNGVVTDNVYGALCVAQQRHSSTIRTCCAIPSKSFPSLVGASSSSSSSGQPQENAISLLHVQQKDKWTCGYRNLQMLLAALVPALDPRHHLYPQTHASNVMEKSGRVVCFEIPSRPELESELEASWRAGFDQNGAQQFGGQMRGRRKWIGAVEVWSILTAAGVDACVVQFIRCAESRSLLGPACAHYFANVCPWCNTNYTTSRDLAYSLLRPTRSKPSRNHTSCGCSRLPLYLQWEGHSVTIVGVEYDATSDKPTRLLILDPAKNGEELRSTLQAGNLHRARLDLYQLRTKDCQIILPSRRVLSAAEQQTWKASINCVTAASSAVIKHSGGRN